ncbi:MAG: D-mannonate epimerase, partial [Oscillospiraceae bacterium]
MFFEGAVPPQAVLEHHWQKDTLTLGVVPKEFVSQISGGLYAQEIEVELNHLLLDGGYDLILSIGQVVPHEVVGMANYSKNLFVGLGGREMINKSHMLGAICGIEQTLGVTDSPVRKLYDYAQQHFLDGKLPIVFVHTVTTRHDDEVKINGLYISEGREAFERAASLSQALNIVHLSRPVKKMVAYLNPEEMKTTW